MPKGYPNKKPVQFIEPRTALEIERMLGDIAESETVAVTVAPVEASPPMAEQPKPAKLIVMKLERNYRPASPFEVVGHLKPAVTRKNMAGVELTISPEQFIEGEPMPAAVAGTGFPHKLLAGTVIRICEDEAKSMRKAGIGSVELLD